MWNYPNFNPVALDLGVIIIHWYAISYLVGIGLVWWTVIIRNKVYGCGWTNESISDLVTYAVFGVILGGRIGYILFYDFPLFDLLTTLKHLITVLNNGLRFRTMSY